MLDKLFDQTIGRVDTLVERSDGDALLRHVKSLYGLSHVAYICLNLPTAQNGSIYYQGTYSDSWVRHYKSNSLAMVDPVVRGSMNSIIPIDWDVLRQRHPEGRHVLDEAVEFGLGKKGLTFPIRGMHGELSFFCITADASEAEWAIIRRTLIRDMQVFATHFHNRILELNGHDTFSLAPTLSPREIDCLRYVASGLTNDATGTRLKITERTVRFHLENARSKLDCLTTTQAIAKSVSLGIVYAS
jgi:DNA-binding CsgD family transcriptional regulator